VAERFGWGQDQARSKILRGFSIANSLFRLDPFSDGRSGCGWLGFQPVSISRGKNGRFDSTDSGHSDLKISED
jgi:hypothetical protein